MPQKTDVIVLGGGIVGASTAYALVNKGKSVRLVDQYQAGHKRGSSHGDGRVVRFNYTEAIYVEMAMHAYKAWDDLSSRVGDPLIKRTGLLEYGPVGDESIQLSERILQDYDIPYEPLSVEQARERFPQYAFPDEGEIIYQPDGAVALATSAVKALWQLFEADGGILQPNTRITQIDIGDTVTLTTASGETLEADSLVITAGGWAIKLAQQTGLTLPLDVTQEILAYFPPKEDATANHHVGTMPVMLDNFKLPDSDAPFYCLPMIDVQGVKMGWHHSGVAMDADEERRIVPEIVAELKNWQARRFPQLQNEPIQVDTCLYTNTPDYHFVLDRHPAHNNVVIGAGFSGHGFKFGPLLGEILASLLIGEASPVNLETFSIARFQDEASLEKRVGA
ncbi:MAG: N-methyl-L-tryptophan oxidase [Chloroflexota bacterium]